MGFISFSYKLFKFESILTSRMEDTYILKINCADQKGLVHKASGVLYEQDFNMIENEEFVDKETQRFFMRSEVIGETDPQKLTDDLRKILPIDAHISFRAKTKKRIVILATKEYHCLGDLLLQAYFGDLNAEILAVISNHNSLRNLVEKFGIPYEFVSHQNILREDHERQVSEIVKSYHPDFLVLAKYMRVLSPGFVQPFSNKIINIHHSFLPAFVGANPYRQAFDRGVKIIGATAHFVNDQLDEGPIIKQDITHVNHKKMPKELSKAGKDLEKVVLSNALKLVFDERVFVYGNKTVIFD